MDAPRPKRSAAAARAFALVVGLGVVLGIYLSSYALLRAFGGVGAYASGRGIHMHTAGSSRALALAYWPAWELEWRLRAWVHGADDELVRPF